VEVPFLSKAKSSLLAEVEVLYDEDGYSCMLCNHIKGSPLEKLELSETDLVSAGKDITREVEAISGTFPVYVDIGTVNLWQSFTDSILHRLKALILARKFTAVDKEQLLYLGRWATSQEVLETINRKAVLVHGSCRRQCFHHR